MTPVFDRDALETAARRIREQLTAAAHLPLSPLDLRRGSKSAIEKLIVSEIQRAAEDTGRRNFDLSMAEINTEHPGRIDRIAKGGR